MPAFPAGGAPVADPPLYPLYDDDAVFVVEGTQTTFSPFSGPAGSPFDAKMYPPGIYMPVPADRVANPDDHSTGALSTGIGFSCADNGWAGGASLGLGRTGFNQVFVPTSPLTDGLFSDDYTPGISKPDITNALTAELTAIGGGKSVATPVKPGDYSNTDAVTTPYAAQPLLNMGYGGSRDAGAGPAFTGFAMKSVTSTNVTALGAAIEPGWINRTAPSGSGLELGNNKHAFGSSNVASPAVT